jgi:hypothetical protein
MVALLLGGFVLAAWLTRGRPYRVAVFVGVAAAGVVGAVGFVLLEDLIVRIA